MVQYFFSQNRCDYRSFVLSSLKRVEKRKKKISICNRVRGAERERERVGESVRGIEREIGREREREREGESQKERMRSKERKNGFPGLMFMLLVQITRLMECFANGLITHRLDIFPCRERRRGGRGKNQIWVT